MYNPLNIAKSALQKIFKSADIDDYVRSRGLSAVVVTLYSV